MMQKPRGTLDYFGISINELNHVFKKLKNIAKLYNLGEIKTPTFEHLELFKKNIGVDTDIINKEIYEFKDKSNRDLALRPEGTASVVRSYVENKMFGNQNYVLKLFYIMNMFRYERPQNGRLREFHQFGVEYLKSNTFYDVIEVIQLANHIMHEFQFDKYILKINNIGNFEQRKNWKNKLLEYFSLHIDSIPIELREKALRNPFRILDEKTIISKQLLENAPKLENFLLDSEKEEFEHLIKIIKELGIPFTIDNTLVRGLDYYTNVVFEFVSTSDNIGKSTIIGGGNYTKLIEDIGGPRYDGLGFAIGIERLIFCLKENGYDFCEPNKPSIYVFRDENYDLTKLFKINSKLREMCHIDVHCLYDEFKKQKILKYCKASGINHILWLCNNKITFEELDSGKIKEYSFETILEKGIFI